MEIFPQFPKEKCSGDWFGLFLLEIPTGGFHRLDIFNDEGVIFPREIVEALLCNLTLCNFAVVNVGTVGAMNAEPPVEGGVHHEIKVLGTLRAPELKLSSWHAAFASEEPFDVLQLHG